MGLGSTYGICRSATTTTLGAIAGIAVILWTVAFDTYYAVVDREDDLVVGIKSTAILFGRYDLLVILLLQLGMLILLAMAGNYFGRGWIYALGLLAAAAYFLNQFWIARSRQPEACFKAF